MYFLMKYAVHTCTFTYGHVHVILRILLPFILRKENTNKYCLTGTWKDRKWICEQVKTLLHMIVFTFKKRKSQCLRRSNHGLGTCTCGFILETGLNEEYCEIQLFGCISTAERFLVRWREYWFIDWTSRYLTANRMSRRDSAFLSG